VAPDPDVTDAIPRSLRRDTPVLASSLPLPADARATLTVLSGIHGGCPVVIDDAPIVIGRAAEGDLVLEDPGVSRRHLRIARAADGAFYAEDLGSTNGTYLGTARIELALLQSGDLLQVGPNIRLRFAIVDSQEESLYRQLYDASVHDPLTHVFNRKYLCDWLLAEISHARLTNGEVVVLMVDVDCLKEVNDRFGHVAGDRALCTIAAEIQRVLRVEDKLARYGGDEFVIVAVGTAGAEAGPLAERVRLGVEGLQIGVRGGEVRITASIGGASLSEIDVLDEPIAALFALADARMYEAKALGKNRVCTLGATPAHDSKRHGKEGSRSPLVGADAHFTLRGARPRSLPDAQYLALRARTIPSSLPNASLPSQKTMGELIDKAKGKIKQAAGILSGNKKLEREGRVDGAKGQLKGAVENVKHTVKEAAKK
jgi:diguanylate cyclase (GGDEF)-like protein